MRTTDRPRAARAPRLDTTAVLGLRSADPVVRARSLGAIATSYWKDTYDYVRRRWNKEPHAAEEITQDFFLRAIDRNTFIDYDPRQSRFRTFLRTCVDRLVVDRDRHQRAKKRGGGAQHAQMDPETTEEAIAEAALDPQALLEAEWIRSLLETSVEAFRTACARRGKDEHFRAFELFHLRDLSHKAIATELGISVGDVNNRLAYARREFRAAVLETLRARTGSEQELHDEARIVLGCNVLRTSP